MSSKRYTLVVYRYCVMGSFLFDFFGLLCQRL